MPIYPTVVGSCNGLGLAQLDSTYIRVSSASMDCIELDERVREDSAGGCKGRRQGPRQITSAFASCEVVAIRLSLPSPRRGATVSVRLFPQGIASFRSSKLNPRRYSDSV